MAKTTPTGSHFAKRTGKGRFKEMDNVGRSSKGDRRTKAKRAVTSGHGNKAIATVTHLRPGQGVVLARERRRGNGS